MRPDDKPAFVAMLGDVQAYYGKDASAFLIDMFWSGLQRFEFQDISRAFSLHAQNPGAGKFAPRLADIIELLEGSTQTLGMRAWSKVDGAVRSVGKMRSVVFDDPLIHAVIADMGGWYQLCCSSDDEMPFKAKDFERRYAAYRLRREIPSFPPCLIGGHEADNKLNGLPYTPKPVLIGAPGRARRVLECGKAQPVLRVTEVGSAAYSALLGISSKREDVA